VTVGHASAGIDTRGRVLTTCVIGAGIEGAMCWRFGWSGALPAYLYFGDVAVVISASDLVVRRVPNHVVLPAYIVGPTLLAVASVVSGQWWTLARAGTAMAILAAIFLVLALASSGGIGLGDCKWAGIVGLYLGWLGWDALSTGVLLGFLTAALFVIGRRIVSSPGTRVLLPFAPFMAGGALAAVFTFSGR
jgi:leader peptidase (prepilin peptidase)/N-methyltransferase